MRETEELRDEGTEQDRQTKTNRETEKQKNKNQHGQRKPTIEREGKTNKERQKLRGGETVAETNKKKSRTQRH